MSYFGPILDIRLVQFMILWQISVVVNFRIIRIWPFEQWSNTGFRSLDHNFLSKNAKTNNSKMDQNCNSTRNHKFRRKKDCPKLDFQRVSQSELAIFMPKNNHWSVTSRNLRQNYNNSINKFIHMERCPKGNSF